MATKYTGSALDTAELPTLPKAEPRIEDVPGSVDTSQPTFPEGGLHAWATVAGAFLIQFCGFGYSTSFGVYQDFYTRDYLLHASPSAISWIGSVNSFIVNSAGLISGRLYDRGHFHLLLYGGSVLQCFSLFMLSLCKPQQLYQIFLAQGVGAGLGAGILYVPSMSIVSHYFRKRRALAMTIVASGASLGAILHPIMLNNTLGSNLGFGGAVRASAGLVTGVLIVACSLMRPRLPPAPAHTPFSTSLRRFASDRAYVLSTIGMTTFAAGFYFPLFYLQLDAIKHGIDQHFSFYSLVIMNASSFVGRLTPGFFVHRLGIMNMIVTAVGCGAALIMSMIALRTITSVVVIAILYGFCAGAYITLLPPLLAHLTEDMNELGLRIGVSFTVVALGGLVGPPIDGALLTVHYFWWRPALFSGLVALIGLTFFLIALVTVRRKPFSVAKKRNQILQPSAAEANKTPALLETEDLSKVISVEKPRNADRAHS